ncbi:MAG: putative xylanase/chitin deacetylase [Planctomycetaceae bacterium]|nr:putative xylanase/chitin deacetylase [Planctomycetaceae bacterium]
MNSLRSSDRTTRRQFLAGSAAVAAAATCGWMSRADDGQRVAQIAITLDLEMSAEYPRRGMTEWNYRKGDLDEATKRYSLQAGELVKKSGGVLHFFCVGQSFEQPSIDWLKELSAAGHPIGNHTYDHIFVKAAKLEELQFRFRRAPWLTGDKSVPDLIRDNIAVTTKAMKTAAGIIPNGFRTPGGFANGLTDRPDLQQMLLDLGFTWVSSKYPAHQTGRPKEAPGDEVFADIVRAQKDAQPFAYPSGLIEIPMSPISDVGAFRTNYWKREYFLRAIRESVTWAIETGGVFDFLAHPSCLVVEDPQLESIQLICDLVKAAGPRATIAGLDQIAKRVPK